jgi:type VI protein secretion system component Hcp
MSTVVLDIPNVEGDCQLEGFQGKILCESLSHDLELEIEMSTNSRRSVHTPKINNIALERKWDSASTELIKRLLLGKVDTNEWTIHCLKAMGDDGLQYKEFLTMKLVKPILAKHSLNVNEGDTTESIEINAVEIQWTYKPHDDTHAVKGNKPIGFDSLKGKVV